MSTHVKLLYIGRSDGLEVLPDGTRNRPSQSSVRDALIKRVAQEDKGTYIPITKDHVNKEIREKYEGEMKKIGEWLVERLNAQGKFDEYDRHVEYRIDALPESFALYQHATESGQLEFNYFGHPRGTKSKYRLASEIAHHIYWLITDTTGDEKNCKCIKCSPQGTIPKEKDVVMNETPTDQGGQFQTGYPSSYERLQYQTSTMAGPAPNTQPSAFVNFPQSQYYARNVPQLDASMKTDANIDLDFDVPMGNTETQPIIGPAGGAQCQTLDPAPGQEPSSSIGLMNSAPTRHGDFDPFIPSPPTNLQQLFDTQMIFYYRPGELVWVDREEKGSKWSLALVTGRDTALYELSNNICIYKVLFLEEQNPLQEYFVEDVSTNHEDGAILPFLALPPDEITNVKLLKALAKRNDPSLNWKYKIKSPESMPSLAAQRVDRSYNLDTKLDIDKEYPSEIRVFDLYQSLWLGAERIWPGDAIRILGPGFPDETDSSDIMIVTHIKETWENPTRDTHDRRNPIFGSASTFETPSTLSVVGDIYTVFNEELQDDGPLKIIDLFLEPHIHEINYINTKYTYPQRRPAFQRILSGHGEEIPLTDVLGRWYPFHIMFPMYDQHLIQKVLLDKSIVPPLASEYLLPRGKHISTGDAGPHGIGERNKGVDLLAAFRCAIPDTASFQPYEGSRWDPEGSTLPLSNNIALGAQHPQPEYDYGLNPLFWVGPIDENRKG